MSYWNEKICRLADYINTFEATDIIVTTNGCFDVFHYGHLHSLHQASRFGTRLVVGINSDSSVRSLKGVGRPFNSEMTRSAVIAALPFVDRVVIFSEKTPEALLRKIKPIVHCKGMDYFHRREDIVESSVMESLGGHVQFLDIIPDLSSTKLLDAFEPAELKQ